MKISDLLTDESKWCKDAMARTADGEATTYDDPNAVQWCLGGALLKTVTHDPSGWDMRYRTIRLALMRLGIHNMQSLNDARSTTFRDIQNFLCSIGE